MGVREDNNRVIIATCYRNTGVEGLEGSCDKDRGEDTSPETTASCHVRALLSDTKAMIRGSRVTGMGGLRV